MPVPEEIRKVPRPKNTTVNDCGRDGPLRYAVRERSGSKYIPGKNPQPHNGRVIGHIINYEYVPVDETKKMKKLEPEEASYGAATLAHSVSNDLYSDLMQVFTPEDVYSIMSMAILRVIKPNISVYRMSTEYKRTFTHVYYPGASLSRNHLGDLLENIGMAIDKRFEFCRIRFSRIAPNHHVIVDGTLKHDNSKVNDLSAYTRREKVKGRKDISLIYAYDVEKMEPVCAEVFPGNSLDSSSYSTFIRDNNIRNCVLICDKGFPPSKIKNELKERPDLHYLTPLKRNDSRISDNNMFKFEGALKGVERRILYKKKQLSNGKFLYAIKDMGKAGLEGLSYVDRVLKTDNFNIEDYEKKETSFGTIVFESDLDMDPKTAYLCYLERWLIEVLFDHCKNNVELKKTNAQIDYTVIGSEFINLISATISSRILQKMDKANLLKTKTYGEIMDDLSTAWRNVNAKKNPKSYDKHWSHVCKYIFEEMELLGISEPISKPEPKKRGRKKKNVETEN